MESATLSHQLFILFYAFFSSTRKKVMGKVLVPEDPTLCSYLGHPTGLYLLLGGMGLNMSPRSFRRSAIPESPLVAWDWPPFPFPLLRPISVPLITLCVPSEPLESSLDLQEEGRPVYQGQGCKAEVKNVKVIFRHKMRCSRLYGNSKTIVDW